MKACLAILACLCASAGAGAAVSTNNLVLSALPLGGLDSDYALTVFQNAEATDPTTVLFNLTDSTLVFETGNIDEGSDWYVVPFGASFTADTIANGEFTIFIKSDMNGVTTNPISLQDGAFFLGVNTGLGFSSTGPSRQFFGWVELLKSGDTLSLVRSAMTYDRPGIVIGTTTTIPEPSATGFFLGSAAILVLWLRRRRANNGRDFG